MSKLTLFQFYMAHAGACPDWFEPATPKTTVPELVAREAKWRAAVAKFMLVVSDASPDGLVTGDGHPLPPEIRGFARAMAERMKTDGHNLAADECLGRAHDQLNLAHESPDPDRRMRSYVDAAVYAMFARQKEIAAQSEVPLEAETKGPNTGSQVFGIPPGRFVLGPPLPHLTADHRGPNDPAAIAISSGPGEITHVHVNTYDRVYFPNTPSDAELRAIVAGAPEFFRIMRQGNAVGAKWCAQIQTNGRRSFWYFHRNDFMQLVTALMAADLGQYFAVAFLDPDADDKSGALAAQDNMMLALARLLERRG